MEKMAYLAFGFYTVLGLGGALWAVTALSLVRAFTGLVTAFFGVAGLYFLLAAPFIGLMQILVYVGAVAVLIFFAIVITGASREAENRSVTTKRKRCLALLAGLVPPAFLAAAILKYSVVTTNTVTYVSIEDLGRGLLGPYSLVFELISVVLFAAMAGAILLGFKRRQ